MREYGFRSGSVILGGGWFDHDGLQRAITEVTDPTSLRAGWTVVYRDYSKGDELLEHPGGWATDETVPLLIAKQDTAKALELLQGAESWLSDTDWTLEDDEQRKLAEDLDKVAQDALTAADTLALKTERLRFGEE